MGQLSTAWARTPLHGLVSYFFPTGINLNDLPLSGSLGLGFPHLIPTIQHSSSSSNLSLRYSWCPHPWSPWASPVMPTPYMPISFLPLPHDLPSGISAF